MNMAPVWPCPACSTPLRRAHADHGVFACDVCGGIWTDHAATQALRTASDDTMASVSNQAASHASFAAEADRPGRCCPACRAPLSQTELAGVAIDYCATHGSWFDRGEMAAVCAATKKGPGPSTGAAVWGVCELCLTILGAFA